jgi:vancomycin permeability regulator SanA
MKAKRVLAGILILLFAWFAGHTIYIIADGLGDDKKTADVAVILGNKVNQDGTLSPRLIKRLECGSVLYKNGRVRHIIVSGGFGEEGFFEGDKMREYLKNSGIPETDITVDNQGRNTRETVRNTRNLRDDLHFSSIIVVSQYFHVTRTKMLFRKEGFREVSGASPYYFEWRDIYSLFREFFAFYNEL